LSAPSIPIRLRTPLYPRSPDEGHRAATPLELFFDLVFVVAIAQASSSFHHAIADNHILDGVTSFLFVFFAIWWAWINFTWFASAYDTDDVAYRLIVFVQLTGALILAAGVTSAFDDNTWGVPIVGYVVMRLAGVIQWIRVALADPERKPAALRYALGIASAQVGWCLMYFAPERLFYPGFTVLVLIELAIPIWAERAAPTTWHAGHIAERYGLFTIIVLGESVLAATLAIESTTIATNFDWELAGIILGALLIVFSMWWLYFTRNSESLLNTMWRAFGWGYGHYFLFSAAAAVGAGIAISVDQATDHAEIGLLGASLAVTIPVAIFIVGVWVLHFRFWETNRFEQVLAPLFALAILLTSWTNMAVLLTGMLVAALVAIEVLIQMRSGEAFETAFGSSD
jgi:low temperature requirement protein LtrA